MRRLPAPALQFVAIGIALYLLVYGAAEWLVYRNGHANPAFKIATATEARYDWVILGASHAMPLDFGDIGAHLQAVTGQRILNLAATGAGPLYNRFMLERFLTTHRAARVLYVVDSFAFYTRAWNEERLADAKLLARTPFDPALAVALGRYALRGDAPVSAAVDYVSGFSKINNRERFRRDAWEGEAQFDRTARASKTAASKRIAYLYPDGTPEALRSRYLDVLARLVETAREAGTAVVVVKLPLPAAFREALPDEAGFDAALAATLAPTATPLMDLSGALPEARYYFDTDHLNRAGLALLVERELAALLTTQSSNH